jgi:hypothetical protein
MCGATCQASMQPIWLPSRLATYLCGFIRFPMTASQNVAQEAEVQREAVSGTLAMRAETVAKHSPVDAQLVRDIFFW